MRAYLHRGMKHEGGLKSCDEALRGFSRRHKMLSDEMKEGEVKGECGMYREEGKCIQGFSVVA